METNQQETVSQTVESGASTETKNVTNEQSNDAVERYKKDMFKYKDRSRELEEKLKSYELAEQQKKGNFEGVISSLKDEIKELKHDNAKKDLNYASSKIDDAIKLEASRRGVKDIDVLMKLIDKNDKDIIELDSSYNVSGEDVKNLMDKQLDRYGHIFKSKVKVVDSTPNAQPINRPEKKMDINKMSGDELFAAIKNGKIKGL